MYVRKNGEPFTTDMTFGLLSNLQKVIPTMKVKITTADGSSYKREEMAEVGDLIDESIYRQQCVEQQKR